MPKSTVNNVVNETEYTAVSDSALEEHHTSQSESFLSVTQNAQHLNSSTCLSILYLNACSMLPKLIELRAICEAISYVVCIVEA